MSHRRCGMDRESNIADSLLLDSRLATKKGVKYFLRSEKDRGAEGGNRSDLL